MPGISRLSPWGRVVAASAVVIVGCAVALAVWNVASRQKRVASYSVRGTLNGVALDLGDADVLVAGGGRRSSVGVEETDRFAFGHDARTVRSAAGGVFRIRSRCPSDVLDSCSARYRVVVPDNVPVDVRTSSGAVTFRGFRGSATVSATSGDVEVDAFCGFSLDARARSGDIAAQMSCPPQQLLLRTTSGSVRAVVPPGRYQVDAESNAGSEAVRGLASAPDAPYSIQALSSSGDVVVESRRP